MSNFTIGDYVYGLWSWDTPVYGKIKDFICTDGEVIFYVVKAEETEELFADMDVGIVCVNKTATFKTFDELMEFIIRKDTGLRDKYLNQIKTIEDLVKFGFDKPISLGEYTDFIARDVYIMKAEELLGIDLS